MTKTQPQLNLWALAVSSTKESVHLYFEPLRLVANYSRKLLGLLVNRLEQDHISPNVLALIWLIINVSAAVFFIQPRNWLFIYSELIIGLVIICWSWRQQTEQHLKKRLSAGFGPSKGTRALEMRLIISGYLDQQRWAFGLVWFSLTIGIVLAGILLARLVFTSKFGYTELVESITLAADIVTLGSALKLYRLSTARLREIFKTFDKGEARVMPSLNLMPRFPAKRHRR